VTRYVKTSAHPGRDRLVVAPGVEQISDVAGNTSVVKLGTARWDDAEIYNSADLFAQALPAGSIILGFYGVITEQWGNGSEGAFLKLGPTPYTITQPSLGQAFIDLGFAVEAPGELGLLVPAYGGETSATPFYPWVYPGGGDGFYAYISDDPAGFGSGAVDVYALIATPAS
jgi:hypothetical protein